MIESTGRQIVMLAKQGIAPREIQARLPGVEIDSIYEILRQARKFDATIPRFTTAGMPRNVTPVFMPNDQIAALDGAAKRRGVTPNDLVRALMAAIVRDGLVDSVLDDLGGAKP